MPSPLWTALSGPDPGLTFSTVKVNPAWAVFALVVVCGCGPARHTVGEGLLQKRTLRRGWHVDLGLHRHDPPVQARVSIDRMVHRIHVPPLPEPEPLAANEGSTPGEVIAAPVQFVGAAVAKGPGALRAAIPALDRSVQPPVQAAPARWNPWAVPAFLIALGTVACAVLGTSEWLVVAAVVATVVMATMAVRKGRMNEWSGKGFAVAALMIGALAGLITLIALLRG